MKIELNEITARELVAGYEDRAIDGKPIRSHRHSA